MRYSAANGLGRMGPAAKAAVHPLVELAANAGEEIAIRRAAAEALGYIGPAAKEAIPKLTELLSDKSPELSGDVAEALERIQVQKK